MLNRLLKLSIALVYFLGLQASRLFQTQRRLVVLCYHEVTTEQRTGFIRQLKMLERHAHTVFADAPYFSQGKPSVAISFDDGYQNLLDNALPELAQRQMPTTLFIPSAPLGQLPPWMAGTGAANEHEIIMTPAQLQALDKNLIQIGSHSVNHPDLSRLASKELEQELRESKHSLEQLLERAIDTLAFPYGRYNRAVVETAREAGYTRIFAADPVYQEDDFLMGRTTASPDDWPLEFYLKIHAAYQWLPIAIAWKRRLLGRPALNAS